MFLVGPVAIKVARVRLVSPLWRAYRLLREGRLAQTCELHREEHGHPLYAALMIFILGGIRANLNERKVYKAFPRAAFAPTYFSFLGLVNVQARGEPIEPQELPASMLGINGVMMDYYDLKYFNMCKIGGTLCLIDYGGDRLQRHLFSQPSLAFA